MLVIYKSRCTDVSVSTIVCQLPIDFPKIARSHTVYIISEYKLLIINQAWCKNVSFMAVISVYFPEEGTLLPHTLDQNRCKI